MVSFDVVSLFTKVPIIDTLRLLDRHFPPGIIRLLLLVLTNTKFQYGGQFYEQVDGCRDGVFRRRGPGYSAVEPNCFFRYVDDTFVISSHGLDNLMSSFNVLIGFTQNKIYHGNRE